MTYERARAAFLQHLEFQIASAHKQLDGWKRKLDTDPEYALSNCDDEFECAAWLSIGARTETALLDPNSKATLLSLHTLALTQVKQLASSGSRSTAATSNLMARCRLRVWAKLEEILAGAIANIEEKT